MLRKDHGFFNNFLLEFSRPEADNPRFLGNNQGNADYAPAYAMGNIAMQRRRFKQILSFPDRLSKKVARLGDEAKRLPHRPERDSVSKASRPHRQVGVVVAASISPS